MFTCHRRASYLLFLIFTIYNKWGWSKSKPIATIGKRFKMNQNANYLEIPASMLKAAEHHTVSDSQSQVSFHMKTKSFEQYFFKVKYLKRYGKKTSYVYTAKTYTVLGSQWCMEHSVSVFYFLTEIKLCLKYQWHQIFYLHHNFDRKS